MHCHICDSQLPSDGIKHTPEYGRGGFAPCSHCEEIIGEIFEPLDEEEVDKEMAVEFYYDDLDEEPVLDEDEG